MTAHQNFDSWMQSLGNKYLNDFAVMVNRVSEYILIGSPWPNHGDASTLSITIICTNEKELFDTLQIDTFLELDRVRPEHLLTLFYSGHATVSCATDRDSSLWFQKIESGMIAGINGEELIHEVSEQLLTPGDFIRHTKQYFSYMKAIKRYGTIDDSGKTNC